MIAFNVLERSGEMKTIEVPGDMNLSLMEVLRASDYPIAATCGGMALCATCHVEVVKGGEKLNAPADAELDMLDTLPHTTPRSRLACQIKINERLQQATFRLMEEE